ncbi:M48 family metallopeptidase [Candidatus Neomarinimicrobiota bacterium]
MTELQYNIVYSDRKTITISVERDRSVVVRAPIGTSPDKIHSIIEQKKFWIYQKQRHPQKYNTQPSIKEFVPGESVLYLGKHYRLEIRESTEQSIKLAGKFIICCSSSSEVRELFRNWYAKKAEEKIVPKIMYFATHMGVSFNKVSITDAKYHWGGCTPSNNLTFGWRLIKAPQAVVDYVIVHELAHLLESNHTQRFWDIVKTQVPMYLKAKNWLKEHGETLEQDL